MSLRTDVINLIVNVNGNQSQNQLNELRKKATDVKLAMDGLKKSSQEYADKKAELAKITGEMDKLKQQIGITALTQKELNAELKKLNALKGSVVPFSKEFNDLEKQIRAVKDRLYDVQNGVTGFRSFLSKITDEVKQFGTMAAAYLGFQFITSQLTNMVQGAGRLSDQLADIRAKTGETANEARNLNKDLGQVDTRTTTKSLRDIATIGGQLGVAKNDIEGFTVSMDKLNVTLGDEFGNNVEELTNKTAKLRNTFGELRTEHIDEDLLHIGNALQVLAQNGVATAPVVTDLSQRIGAAGTIYGMTAGEVFGLSASYQELGITSERGGTATVKLLQKISSAPAMFFDIVKSVDPSIDSLDKFKNLINTDITKALLLVSKGFAESKGNATEFAEKLADAEIGSAAISEVLSKLGQNTDMVSGKMKLAGDALKSTSSITEQFAIKNETFGATLDKVGKEFSAFATSSGVTSFLQSAVQGLLDFIRWLRALPQWLADNRTELILLATVVLAYAAAQSKATLSDAAAFVKKQLLIALDKTYIAILWLQQAAIIAYTYVTDVMTGKIKLATVAQQLWNLVLKANPLVLIISLAGAAAAAISYFTSKVKELTDAQKLNSDIQQRAASKTAEEIGQAKLLYNALQTKNIAHQRTTDLLKQLIAINPEYLSGLTEQNIKTKEGKDILDKYIDGLKTKAQLEAKNDLLKEKYKSRDEAIAKLRAASPAGTLALTDDQLIDQATKVAGLAKKNGITDVSVSGVDLAGLTQTVQQIKILEADVAKSITSSTTAAVSGAGNAATGAARVTLKTLKDQLQALNDAYIQIDVTNKKALQQNQNERKKLQAQIDELEGKSSPEAKRQEKTYAELKKQAADFYKDVETLRRHANNNDEDENNRALNAIRNKYGDLIQKVHDYNAELAKSSLTKLQKSSLKHEADGDILALLDLQKKEISDYIRQAAAKNFEKAAKEEYEQAKLDLQGWQNTQLDANTKAFNDGQKTLSEYERNKLAIEKQYQAARVLLAKDYAATVKQAGEDVVTETHKQQEEITNNLIAQTKAREAFQEKENAARQLLQELGISKALSPAANRAFADNRARQRFNKTVAGIGTDLAKNGEDSSKEAVMATEQYKAAYEQMQHDLANNSKSFWQNEIEQVMQWVGYVQQAMQGLNQILTNAENRRMQQEIAANDKRRKSFSDQLNNKLISQARYDLQMKKMDEQQDKDQKKLQYDQAKREKGLKIFEAVINTAAAVAKALPNIPLSVAAGILGAIQIAAIASAPLPSMGVGGALKNGPYHSDATGGLHVINPQTGKVEMLLEKDEGVLKGSAMRSSQQYTLSGTPSQITSALNAMHGGVNWATGAKIVEMPQWWSKPAQINPNLPRIMAGGGSVAQMQNKPGNEAGSTGNSEDFAALQKEVAGLRDDMKNWNKELHAIVSIKEYREKEKLYDASVKASGL